MLVAIAPEDENYWRECTTFHNYFAEDVGNHSFLLRLEITRFRIVPFSMSKRA